jgi:predicted nucleic acid-binding protein
MNRILVDTSIWIDHLRSSDDLLVTLLNNHRVLMHSMIKGELACGHLRHRLQILTLLKHLPRAAEATRDEAMTFIDNKQLMGRGIGFVDVHLLAATVLTPGARIWTRDNRLSVVAQSLEIAWQSD